MSNYDSQIYKKLGTILVIQLVFILISNIIFIFIYWLSYITAISIFLTVTSIMIMTFWVIRLSKLYQTSEDSSVKSASKLFLSGLVVRVLQFLLVFVAGFLFLYFNISAEFYYIVLQYLPYLAINSLYLIAWVKLSKYFKTTLVSNNGKIGCILITISKIPSILIYLVYIILTILYGPMFDWEITLLYAISSPIFSYGSYLGIILEIVGYILLISVFKKAYTPQSQMTPIYPDSIDRNYITPGEPTLNNPQYCTNCGTVTVPGATFCNQCGHKM